MDLKSPCNPPEATSLFAVYNLRLYTARGDAAVRPNLAFHTRLEQDDASFLIFRLEEQSVQHNLLDSTFSLDETYTKALFF